MRRGDSAASDDAGVGSLHLIMEDDAQFAPGWVDKWAAEYLWAVPADADIIFLGGVVSQNAALWEEATNEKRVNRRFTRHRATTGFSHNFDASVDPPLDVNPRPL